jgi:thioredoxin 1
MDVNSNELKELIASNELVVVDFWAPWCGPCKVMGPVFQELAEDNPDIAIKKVNIDEERDLAMEFAVRSIPSFLYIKNGKIVDKLHGTHDKATLQNKIEEHE